MGIQEKEIVELYRAMETAAATPTSASKPPLKLEVIAILTAARILKRVVEKCTIEVCGAIEGLKQPDKYAMTLHQANAIIDMDNHGYSNGLCSATEEDWWGWNELLKLAELVTGRTAYRNLSDQQEARQDFGDMTPPGGGRMV